MPTVKQWLDLLEAKIAAQAHYAKPWETRYDNRYVLPFIRREYAEVYGDAAASGVVAQLAAMDRIHPPQAGTAAIVVDALTERMTILGAQSESEQAAAIVEAAWEANDLDVMHREAHRESMIKGRAFALVDNVGGKAVVSVESAEQMAVHREVHPPYDVDAALKIYTDEWTGSRRGALWIPGKRFTLLEEHGQLIPTDETKSSRVPVVEFAHRPRLLKEPQSEIEGIWTLVDLVDLIEGLMVFAGHFGAVPIRYGTGLKVATDPANPKKPLLVNGKPTIGFDPRADRMWVSTEADASFGQLTPATLETFVQWAQHASMRIRAKTSLASTYLSMDLKSHMSAELLKTDEAPMVRRVESLHGAAGQAWRRVQQLILEIENPALALKARVRPRWADPQTRVESQDADMFGKLAPKLGTQMTAEKVLGWSPAEAKRGADEARADLRAADAELDAVMDRLNSNEPE